MSREWWCGGVGRAAGVVGLGAVLGGGCGTAQPAPAESSAWFRPALAQPTCLVATAYSEQAVAKIVRMREAGESLRAVATEVGGTRQEVKCAERSARNRPRNAVLVQLSGR
jgi:hypothetical protein